MTTTTTILERYGVTLTTASDDAARVTSLALPAAEARALVADLAAAGVEASDAPDHDDRGLAWVYVAEPVPVTYAAIGTDGTRPVVWGIGSTEEAALADAATQEDVSDDLRVVAVSADVVARVEAGDVDAAGL